MITLVRHVATDWSGIRYCGRTDAPLSRAGREQLASLVAYLRSVVSDPPAVVSSPASRCRETATAIASALGAEVSLDERLREIDFGDAEGLTFAEVERRWKPLAERLAAGDGRADWPHGESWRAFAERVRAAWTELAESSSETIVVTHGGPLRSLLELALPTWPEHLPQRLGPATVVRLARSDGWILAGSWSARDGSAA